MGLFISIEGRDSYYFAFIWRWDASFCSIREHGTELHKDEGCFFVYGDVILVWECSWGGFIRDALPVWLVIDGKLVVDWLEKLELT